MKKDLTELIVVLDESGSMGMVRNDTIGGFNTFLETHQALPGEAKLTLVKFSNLTSIAYNGIDVKEVRPLNNETYFPSGGTALFDAVGKTIELVTKRINNTPDDEVAEKVIFLILTDGEENSSHEYTKDKVFENIETMKKNFNWEFLFIGANQDAWAAGSGIGINQNVNYNVSDTKKAMKSMTFHTSNSRSVGSDFATLYNVAGVGVIGNTGAAGTKGVTTDGKMYSYVNSFQMSEDELDKELAKFQSIADLSTNEKQTKKSKKK